MYHPGKRTIRKEMYYEAFLVFTTESVATKKTMKRGRINRVSL